MQITLNGQRKGLSESVSLEALLEAEGFAGKKVAVAVNGQFVPKTAFAETAINDNDEIEIVAPMQGG